jgi:putative redox protein
MYVNPKEMATSKVEYLGGLRTKCTHLKSGQEVITDAPVDNNGKGEAFSPTDLVATAYISCMYTIIGIYCENQDIHFDFGNATITKIMGSNPRSIERIEVELDFTGNNWDEKIHQRIKNVGEGCPVAKTLGDNVELKFNYKF